MEDLRRAVPEAYSHLEERRRSIITGTLIGMFEQGAEDGLFRSDIPPIIIANVLIQALQHLEHPEVISGLSEEASEAYNQNTVTKQNEDTNRDFYGKANQRIPIWAVKPNQFNHKIIQAYYKAIATTGRATIEMMKRLCSDKNNPEMNVPTFKNNITDEVGWAKELRKSI